MGKLLQLVDLLKGLSEEDIEKLKATLQPTDNTDEVSKSTEETATADSAEEQTDEPAAETTDSEDSTDEPQDEQPTGEETTDSADDTEITAEGEDTATPTETAVESEDNAEVEQTGEGDIETPSDTLASTDTAGQVEDKLPRMQKIVQGGEDDNVTDEDSITDTTEYEAVISSLNAKAEALEQENKALKAELDMLRDKTDGAFGYSAKVGNPVKVNPLYGKSDGVRMHKL